VTVLLRGNRNYTADDANRADSDAIGGIWRVELNGSPRIRTNRFEFKTMSGSPGRAGCWVSADGLETDNYEIRAQLTSPTGGSLATDNITALVMAYPDGTTPLAMAVFATSTGVGQGIFSQIGSVPSAGQATGGTGSTSRYSSATNVPVTSLITFRRQMYSATQSIFTGTVNGVETARWDDSGGLISSGPGLRRWGFIVEGNHPLFGSDYRSPAIDWIEARDLW
jgi:hypothetical protein